MDIQILIQILIQTDVDLRNNEMVVKKDNYRLK